MFHTVLTAAACFLPSADNYLSRLGFVTIACFLLATLSADNAPQILDRCRGICSGDAVRGIITALFSSPPKKKNKNQNKQTHSLPWHRVRLASQHCVVLRGAARHGGAPARRSQLWFTWSAGSLGAPFRYQQDPLSVERFPSRTLSFAHYLLLLWPFYTHLALFHLLAITRSWARASAPPSTCSIITSHFTLH